MAENKRDTEGFGNRDTNLELNDGGDTPKTGMGIANDQTLPRTLISDDSKNDVAKQDHHGSDNKPNASGARQ